VKFPPLEVNKLQDYEYGDILNDEYFENLINTLEDKKMSNFDSHKIPLTKDTPVRLLMEDGTELFLVLDANSVDIRANYCNIAIKPKADNHIEIIKIDKIVPKRDK
jgi:hypothetical protein